MKKHSNYLKILLAIIAGITVLSACSNSNIKTMLSKFPGFIKGEGEERKREKLSSMVENIDIDEVTDLIYEYRDDFYEELEKRLNK